MGRRYDRCISRSEEHTSELQSHHDLVCRLLLEKKKPSRRRPIRQRRTPRQARRRARRRPRASFIHIGTPRWSTMSSAAFFFFNDTATTEIYTLSLHDALPI